MAANDETNPPTTKTTNPLHHFQVSPPPGTLPSTITLPITFFDIQWLNSRPMRRLFFYDFPHPTTHFTQSILPSLRRSLSLTLQHFFPLAGNLVTPPPPQPPFLRFSDGVDSVSLIIAESTDDYNHLTGNHPRDVTELHPFVLELNPPTVESDGSRLAPLLALQVTLFPNRGLCIGARFHHVAADGMAFHHFMKFWASLLRSGCDVSSSDIPLPCHDREMIREKYGDLESVMLKQYFDWQSSWNYNAGADRYLNLSGKVRSTIVITKPDLDNLKSFVRKVNLGQQQLHVSAFVVTCALVWVALIRSEGLGDSSDDPDRFYHFGFSADCRRRLGIELPETYFGNCIGPTIIGEKRGVLLSTPDLGGGIARAAELIGERVMELERNGGGVGAAERWLTGWKEVAEGGRVIVIAGSPKLKAYETDFGWGRPRKSEVVQVDSSRSVSLSESGDGSGGVEVGLALDAPKMEVFRELIAEFLAQLWVLKMQ